MRKKINMIFKLAIISIFLIGMIIYYWFSHRTIFFVKQMGVGTNLGNSLDSTGLRQYEPDAGDLEYETYWGNPLVGKEYFGMIYDAGFRTVRIPVTWEDHLDAEGNISEVWMNRVQEVVDMALEQGLYVIINLHHEAWLNLDIHKEQEITDRFGIVWKQIAERFSEYDERLIFESMNEPRLRDSEYEWGEGTPELRAMVNRLNERFVRIIREAEGNNPERYLMICPYATSHEPEAMRALTVPDRRIIVSVHAYIPYEFCQKKDGTKKWDTEELNARETIKEVFREMHVLFLSKGVPVIITEFGCKDKDNIEERISWTEYFTGQAKKNGISYIWWDCDDYKLIDRYRNRWIYPELAEILTGEKVNQ